MVPGMPLPQEALPVDPLRRAAQLFSGTVGARRLTRHFCLVLLPLLCCALFPSPGHAADNLFNSGAAIKAELSRISDEGKLFVKAPVDTYPAQSAALVGAFALTYIFDRDIRSDLAGAHSGTLKSLTDGGSFVGNPFLHIGVAAALYGAGAATEAPRFMRLGEELGEALLLADGTSFALQEAIGRGRPASTDGNSRYRPFQFKSDYDSLPSMHTASSFAVAHVLASKTQSLPVKILCYATAGFVGFSRLYQEKHWASDLVLGAAIGELAGDSVTRYYALQERGLTVAPLSIGGVPSLALLGKF
jgi:membrane-associated phospholipid phosphatase